MPSTVLDQTSLVNPVGAQPGHVAVAGTRIWTVRNTGGAAPAGTFLSYSDDEGVTWIAGPQIGTASTVYSHVAALQTTGGAWVLVAVSANVGGSTSAALSVRSMTAGVNTGTPGALSASVNIDAGGTGLGVANASIWTTGGTNPRFWIGARKNGTNAATPATSATNYWARLWHCPIANVGTASSWVGVNVPGTWGNGDIKPVVGTAWTVAGALRCTVVALDPQATTTTLRVTDQYLSFTFDPQPATIALGTGTVMAVMTTGRKHSSMAAQTGGHSQTIEARADYLLFARQDGATTDADWDLFKTVNGTTWTAPAAGQGIVAGRLSMDTDDAGNFCLAWRTTAGAPSNTTAPMVYAKWTAATDTLGPTTPLSDTQAGQLKIYVGPKNLIVLYRDGTVSPYNLRADYVPLTATVDATAALTGSGTLSAPAVRAQPATVQLTANGALTAQATRTVPAAAALTAVQATAGTGVTTTPAAAALTSSGTLTAVASAAVSAAAALSATSTSTVDAVRSQLGAAALTATADLTGHAVRTASATADLTATGVLSASAARAAAAGAALISTSATSITATHSQPGAAPLAASSELVADVTLSVASAAPLAAAHTTAAGGALTRPAAVALPAKHDLAGTSTVQLAAAADLAAVHDTAVAATAVRSAAVDLTGTHNTVSAATAARAATSPLTAEHLTTAVTARAAQASIDLTGTAVLSGAGQAAGPAAAPLNATSHVTAATTAGLHAAAALLSTGDLVLTATTTRLVAAPLAASGTLTGAAARATPATAGLAGSGALQVPADLIRIAAASLRAVHTANHTAVASRTGAADLTAVGVLVAAAAGQLLASVALRATGALDARAVAEPRYRDITVTAVGPYARTVTVDQAARVVTATLPSARALAASAAVRSLNVTDTARTFTTDGPEG